MSSFIAYDNHLALFLIVIGAATFGIISEHKNWFGKLSGIVVTMISMAILAIFGVIPVAYSKGVNIEAYNLVDTYFIPIAIPTLLFSANIKKIINESGRLLFAYIVGAIAIVIGSFVAFNFIALGEQSANTAGVISSTLIGGSLNFNATAKALSFESSPLFTATIAVDVLVSNLYTILLIFIPSMAFLSRLFVKPKKENLVEEVSSIQEEKYPITLERMAVAIFLAIGIALLGEFTAPFLQSVLNTDINMSILLITLYSIAAANFFPKQLKPLEDTSFALGLWMMYVFLAIIGASTDINQILNIGSAVLGFYCVILLFHLFVMLILAKLLKLDVYEVVISSAANVMGPSVAAPMAASMGQKKLVTPGILVGILGYVIGTFVGVGVAVVLG